MDSVDFVKIFQDLNIEVQELPINYSPDEFAEQLMSSYHGYEKISYAAATESVSPMIIRDDCAGIHNY